MLRRGVPWIAGLAGVGLNFTGVIISALTYQGRLGEPYSPLNHFISELGEVSVASMAMAFNVGIFLGGLCLTIFLVGLGLRIGGWLGVLFALVGTACGLSGALVGVFPLDNLAPHFTWAMRFFNFGLLASSFFSLLALFRRGGLPRWLALPGLLSVLAFAAFLYLPSSGDTAGSMAGADSLMATISALSQPRPPVWQLAVLEWAALGSVMIWALIVAAAMLWENRASTASGR